MKPSGSQNMEVDSIPTAKKFSQNDTKLKIWNPSVNMCKKFARVAELNHYNLSTNISPDKYEELFG